MRKLEFVDCLVDIKEYGKHGIVDIPQGSNVPSLNIFHNPVEILCEDGLIVTESNACIIVPEHTRRFYRSVDERYHESWIHFDAGNTRKFADELGLPLNKVFYIENCDQITHIIMSIYSEHIRNRKFSAEIISHQLFRLFYELASSVITDDASYRYNSYDFMNIRKIRYEFLKDMSRNWTVEEMAGMLNCSTTYFTAQYKKCFGKTPKQDIIEQRIIRSQIMLANNTLTVDSVAAQVGFNTTQHFIYTFKKYTGITPKQFAKRVIT